MKKIFLLAITFTTFYSNAQVNTTDVRTWESFVSMVFGNMDRDSLRNFFEDQMEDPDVYNEAWKILLDRLTKFDGKAWKYLDDMNVEFKTFQNPDSSKASLGFSYDFDFNWSKFVEKKKVRFSHNLELSAEGNVAFNKRVNPNDFNETSFDYQFRIFSGGVVKNSDTSNYNILNTYQQRMLTLANPRGPEGQKIMAKYLARTKIRSQFYFGINPKFGFESNQDFSKYQFVPGVKIGLGMKAWNNESLVAKLNIFDYPAALLRLITRTDKKWAPRGSTIPTIHLGFDYVIPQGDTLRENLVGNKDPFPRIHLETGFRSYIAQVKNQRIYFNANIRYYTELGAEQIIQDQELANSFYYSLALESSSGFFVSYSQGKLPFDAQTDQIYSLGFNFNF